MEKIRISDLIFLDTQTRILSCIRTQRTITLGISACRCLKELTLARGEILSQDELLYHGWRQDGIEVTSSSLRVAISQLRRAFLSLQTEKDIVIVTITKVGYRIITPKESTMSNEVPLSKLSHVPVIALPLRHKVLRRPAGQSNQFLILAIVLTLSLGLLLDLAVSLPEYYQQQLRSSNESGFNTNNHKEVVDELVTKKLTH